MKVLLLGASGLVGRECLALLLANPTVQQVDVWLRSALTPDELLAQVLSPDDRARLMASPMLSRLHVRVVDFDHLDDLARQQPHLFQVDAVVCALGSTIKQAGSQAAFKRVDHDYPLAVARLVKAQGAQHFLLVSALGASAQSRVFYNRVKGEVEQAIAALNFQAFTVAQPSLLLGHRTEFRPAEWFTSRLSCLIPMPWTPVHVRQVARGLDEALHHSVPGRRILNNRALRCHLASRVAWPVSTH